MDTQTTETGNFSAKQEFDIYNEQHRDRTILPDVEQSAEDTLKKASRRKQSVRLSPMASALLQKRNGVYLPPTHFATPSTQREILNPACTSALRVHLKQTGPVAVPSGAVADQTISMQRRLHDQWINEKNEVYGDPSGPVSNTGTSDMDEESPVAQEPSSVPFFPAMHECLTKNLLKTDNRREASSALRKFNPNFVARAPRERVNKRALIIGVEYSTRTNTQLNAFGFGQTVEKWYNIVIRDFQFLTKEIRILSDAFIPGSGKASVCQPTYSNIRVGFQWLFGDAKKGDHLFLSYTGDVRSVNERETDPKSNARYGIISVDYPSHETCLWGQELQDMIKSLPNGVRVTIFLDCRCSSNLISLPYIYRSSKCRHTGMYEVGPALPAEYSGEQSSTSSFMSVFRKSRAKWHEKERIRNLQRLKHFEDAVKQFENGADVVCFATAPQRNERMQWLKNRAPQIGNGEYTDAVEKAFNELQKEGSQTTYRNLMFHICDRLSPRGETIQLVPQFCSTKKLDINEMIPL